MHSLQFMCCCKLPVKQQIMLEGVELVIPEEGDNARLLTSEPSKTMYAFANKGVSEGEPAAETLSQAILLRVFSSAFGDELVYGRKDWGKSHLSQGTVT